MKKNLQRFGASVLAAAMVAQSVALPAAAETTKIDSSVAQSVAASAASAASAVQSLPKFTSTADLIKQTAQTLAAQGEVHELDYMSEDGVLYTMTRGASPRFGGGDLMVQPLENIVADADIKGIKDEFFVIVPDDEHEGCFLPYLYVQLKDGYTLDDVRDKINACLPERYMRPVEIFTVPERPFFHFKTNRIGLSKEIIAKRNQQKEKAKRNSFADGCIA